MMLDHKIAIVTGASSGIGAAAALAFAREGARLVISARRPAELAATADAVRRLGGEVEAIEGDLRDARVAARLVEAARDRFGGVDIALNNAGMVGDLAPLPDLTLAAWRDVIDVNLTSSFLAAKFQLPAMLERGRGALIFTSTFVGHTAGMPGMAAYAASKAGLIGLVQVIAAEFGPRGIRANALLPGGTDTAMGRAVAATPEQRAFVANLHALKRLAAPEEIGNAALFLASDAASFVTGTALLVDGGVSINRT